MRWSMEMEMEMEMEYTPSLTGLVPSYDDGKERSFLFLCGPSPVAAT